MQHPEIQMILAKDRAAQMMREAQQARLAASAKSASPADRAARQPLVRRLVLRLVASLAG